MKLETVIKERYQILEILGQGGSGTTYRAKDIETGNDVALKEMSLIRLREWKDIDLLEREAQVLSYLDHPAIPKYLDYFEIDSKENHYFYLVQELAKGQTLFKLIESGWRVTEQEVLEIAAQILEVLIYLHSQSPPILHRDLKPHNIIRSADKQIFLVDFGSVRHAYWNRYNQGITVVGTLGYMAPEQDRGLAYPASDLYGLGSTLLFLLTQRSPAELPQKRLKLDFRSRLQITPELAQWLDKMLEPIVENRFHSAREALKALQYPILGSNPVILASHKPIGSHIKLTQTSEQLLIDIPPASLPGFRGMGGNLNLPALIALLLVISCLLISLFYLSQKFSFVVIYLIVFSLYFLLFSRNLKPLELLFRLLGKIKLVFAKDKFYIRWSFLGINSILKGKTYEITEIKIIENPQTKIKLSSFVFKKIFKLGNTESYTVTINKCALITEGTLEGYKVYEFGQFISQREREWLVEEITKFVKKTKH